MTGVVGWFLFDRFIFSVVLTRPIRCVSLNQYEVNKEYVFFYSKTEQRIVICDITVYAIKL